MTSVAPKIAVIGAGMAGLACADALRQSGLPPIVYDKGRGLGGRMATRRAEGGFQFDHGAQYLTAQCAGFGAFLKEAEAAGAAARWPPDHASLAFVGTPGMTGLAKHLAKGLNITNGTRIERIVKAEDQWALEWEGGRDVFNRVVITAPAPQIGALIPDGHPFNAELERVRMDPCLTLMVGLASAVTLPFLSRRASAQHLSWIACDSEKPQRPSATCIVAQASRDWSLQHLELERDAIAERMFPLLIEAIGQDLIGTPDYVSAHRWRYAFVSQPLGQPFLANSDQTLFAGGDWCLGAKAEHAWTSGRAIAHAIANTF